MLTDGDMTAQFGEGFRSHLLFFVGGFNAFESKDTQCPVNTKKGSESFCIAFL